MTNKFIVAHDLGTSSDKAILVSIYGDIIHIAKRNYPLYHPHAGFAEQESSDWWTAVCETTREVIEKSGTNPHNIVGMTFSTQIQGLVPISRDGSALMRAITWLDSRGADIIRETLWKPPRILGYNVFNVIRFIIITGGSPGQAGKDIIGKLLWIKKNLPDVFENTYKFLDVKDFIIYKLTNNLVTSTDVASVWWLSDTRKNRNQWHPGLCKLGGITVDKLPEIKASASIVGHITEDAAKKTGLLAGTPVINGAGDLSAAGVGSGALDEGEMHICIGTSGWVAGHFTKRKIDIPHYTGCIGSAYPQKYYLGMAHQETAGVCLEWLKNKILYHKDQLLKEENVEEIYQILDQLAEQARPGAEGLIFTPWMFGERCPLDDDYVRAGLYNVSLNHSREHLVRAVFEGIAFNTRWAMETLEKLYVPVTELNMIGGGAKSNIWCQIMADITNRKINQVADPQQAGAKGMALLASMTLGYIDSFEDIKKYIKINNSFIPTPSNRTLYDRLFVEFKNLYKQNKNWFRRMNTNRPIEHKTQ